MRFRYKKTLAFGAIALAFALVAALSSHGRDAGPLPVASVAGSIERLKIPSIGVDAAIERVSLTQEGNMDTPDGPLNVGWYSLGPYPGEAGSAVIAGHRGWKNGEPAVFDELDRVREGDAILVTDPQGKEHSFVVRETRIYKRDSQVPEVFVSEDGIHLNLITCVGAWNADLQSREERLVVFADLAP